MHYRCFDVPNSKAIALVHLLARSPGTNFEFPKTGYGFVEISITPGSRDFEIGESHEHAAARPKQIAVPTKTPEEPLKAIL
jgi:hypothetical protein